MSHQLILNPHFTLNNNHNSNKLISFPTIDHLSPHPALHVEFEPVWPLKLASLLFVFLLIPLLSLAKFLPRSVSPRRTHSRHRQRRQLPATYEPPQTTVEAAFVPLPTRRHFRISHVGNRRDSAGLLAEPHSDSSDCSDDEDPSRVPVQRCRLVFGKQLRGEEPVFSGRSALKGARAEAAAALVPTPPIPPKRTSFAGSGRAPRLTTKLDSTISFLCSNACPLNQRSSHQI